MPRNLVLLLLLILCLAPFAGFAWLTHHPEAEILVQAQEWPVVGPLASWFRDQYLPPHRKMEGNASTRPRPWTRQLKAPHRSLPVPWGCTCWANLVFVGQASPDFSRQSARPGT